MNNQNLTTFKEDIKKMDMEESIKYTSKIVSYIQDNEMKLEDFNYIKLYAYSLGMLNKSGELLEEYHTMTEIDEDIPPITSLLPTNGADNVDITSGKTKVKYKNPNEKNNIDKNTLNEDTEIFNEAANMVQLRKEATKKVLDVLAILDKDGKNVEKYKKYYESMNDQEFDSKMRQFLLDDHKNFYLEIIPNKSEPSMDDIEKALDYLNIPENEYVWYKHDGDKDDPVRTKCRVPVGYVNCRRVQQILSKKNTYSLDIDKRDMKTGQVTSDDKIARIADTEAIGLTTYGAKYALKEFFGPRADSMAKKREMYKQINKYGYVYYDDLEGDIRQSQSLNTIYTYLMGAGLANDLLVEPPEEVEARERRKNDRNRNL